MSAASARSSSGDRLRSGLSLYAEYRLSGPLHVRLAEASWDLHTTVLARFYDWAIDEGHAVATPFTYGSAKRLVHGHLVDVRRNLAKLRSPCQHTTIKYLERDFAELLLAVLEGLLPDETPDPAFRGHHPGRNSAVARLVLSSGLRKREFTFLLAPEVPGHAVRPHRLQEDRDRYSESSNTRLHH